MTDARGLFHIDSESQTTGMQNCGAVLRTLRSLVPNGLVGDLEWERLVVRTEGLPASVLGLEFRLDDREPNADLLLGLVPGSRAEEAHIRRGRDARPGSPEAVLANYFARVRGAEFPEAELITRTILEYDVGRVASDGRWPPPAVFQGLKDRSSPDSGIRDPEVAGRIASAIRCAVGRADDAQEIAGIREVVAALPPDGRLAWLGVMPGRNPRMIRALIHGLDADGLVDSLQRIGWQGQTETVSGVLNVIDDQFARLAIQLEVSAQGVLPRLGIEVYVLPKQSSDGFADWSTAANPELWRPALSRLEDAGWCLPLKMKSLLTFPGREYVIDDGIFLVHKGINHVKISIETGQPCTAKAYVGMFFLPVNT